MSQGDSTILVPPPGGDGLGVSDELRDVKTLVSIPSVWDWLAPVLAGVAAGLLLALIYGLWRQRRKQAVVVPELIIPAHVRARERLRAALALIGQPEPFCVAISHGLRVYLEERFLLKAPERTTEEFLDELQASPRLALRQKERLGDFLARCDLVKFARHEPAEDELRELYEAAMHLVEETAGEDSDEEEAGMKPGVMGVR